jgi:dihydroorotate dehydrogenase (NAD+) catalytic subunit
MTVELNVSVGGVDLTTPVILSSGCAGYGDEWGELVDLAAVGAVVMKGVSLEPWPGNPPPRLAEAPSGVINAIGLENVGVEAFLAEKLAALPTPYPCRLVANVVGRTPAEYVGVCERLDAEDRLDALELNVSCPNVKEGGSAFGADAAGLRVLVRNCREATVKPLWVKLPPLVTDVVPLAKAALAGGADALVVANTLPAMAVDVPGRQAVLGNTYGGLSGPAVRPVILRLVHRVFVATGAQIIASGGVDSWEAAAAYVLAGARAVSIGTALFTDPATPGKVCEGLRRWLEEQGFAEVSEAVGALKT